MCNTEEMCKKESIWLLRKTCIHIQNSFLLHSETGKEGRMGGGGGGGWLGRLLPPVLISSSSDAFELSFLLCAAVVRRRHLGLPKIHQILKKEQRLIQTFYATLKTEDAKGDVQQCA